MIVSIVSLCTPLASNYFIRFAWIELAGFISALVTIILIFLNTQEKYIIHLNLGNQYLQLRNQIRIFKEIERINMNIEMQQYHIKYLADKRDILNNIALAISSYGYKNAKKQIEKEQTQKYHIDKELQ